MIALDALSGKEQEEIRLQPVEALLDVRWHKNVLKADSEGFLTGSNL